MLIYNFIETFKNIGNYTSERFFDDEDITFIINEEQLGVVFFPDQPFNYISNSSLFLDDIDSTDIEFAILVTAFGALCCSLGCLLSKVCNSTKSVDIEKGNPPSYPGKEESK